MSDVVPLYRFAIGDVVEFLHCGVWSRGTVVELHGPRAGCGVDVPGSPLNPWSASADPELTRIVRRKEHEK